MNVVLHSARNVFYLLVANCIWGIITASVCSLFDDIERFVFAIVRKRFVSFSDYIGFDVKKRISVIFIDLMTCLLAASFMLFTAFVYNSGNFRIISIPIFITGFAIGKRVLRRIIQNIVNRILFCLKWILDISSFPIIWLTNSVVKLLSDSIKKRKNKNRTKILTKYTEYCFAHIKDEAKYGLLDDYYKELENERTV